jgi:hypothetical protein
MLKSKSAVILNGAARRPVVVVAAMWPLGRLEVMILGTQ